MDRGVEGGYTHLDCLILCSHEPSSYARLSRQPFNRRFVRPHGQGAKVQNSKLHQAIVKLYLAPDRASVENKTRASDCNALQHLHTIHSCTHVFPEGQHASDAFNLSTAFTYTCCELGCSMLARMQKAAGGHLATLPGCEQWLSTLLEVR